MFDTIRPRLELIACVNNLKNLRIAFSDYAETGWPQVPENIEIGSNAEQQWWLDRTEKDLGLSQRDWQCPTIRRLFLSQKEKDRPLIHYLPTLFSNQPGKANQWPGMPWFIEIGDAHGNGNLMVRQSGVPEPVSQ